MPYPYIKVLFSLKCRSVDAVSVQSSPPPSQPVVQMYSTGIAVISIASVGLAGLRVHLQAANCEGILTNKLYGIGHPNHHIQMPVRRKESTVTERTQALTLHASGTRLPEIKAITSIKKAPSYKFLKKAKQRGYVPGGLVLPEHVEMRLAVGGLLLSTNV